jgi:hypothetical protein
MNPEIELGIKNVNKITEPVVMPLVKEVKLVVDKVSNEEPSVLQRNKSKIIKKS